MHRFAFIITPIHTTLFYQLHKIKKKKKTELQILQRFGSTQSRFQISQSDDFTASASEWRAKSEHWHRLIRSALQLGRCRQRRLVRSALVKFGTPLVWSLNQFICLGSMENQKVFNTYIQTISSSYKILYISLLIIDYLIGLAFWAIPIGLQYVAWSRTKREQIRLQLQWALGFSIYS